MAKNGISTISWNTCRLVSWQLLLLLPPRLRLSKRRETRRVENISMMELFRFSLKKFLSSDGILVYLLMALRCGISRLGATNLLNFCYIQKFSKPFLFTSHRNILNPKLEYIIYFERYTVTFPLSCNKEISHIFVSYSAERMRSSASRRLFWASRISIPDKSPSR